MKKRRHFQVSAQADGRIEAEEIQGLACEKSHLKDSQVFNNLYRKTKFYIYTTKFLTKIINWANKM